MCRNRIRQLSVILLIILLFSFISPVTIQAVKRPVQEPPVEKVEEEKTPENGEDEPEEEPRDQEMIVPTIEGPDHAKKSEVERIQELEKKSNEELISNYLIGDYTSGKILKDHKIDEVVGLASTTKIMTVYVALDAVRQGEVSLDDEIVIDEEVAKLPGSTFELKEGDIATLQELIEAGLIVSGNDAMVAMAKHISGTEEAFVARMNKTAQQMGLTHAHFINPHGLTDYEIEDYNKMTTRELFILTTKLIKEFPEVLKITSKPYIKEEHRNYLCYNTNPLLGIVPNIDGLKTGYTGAAGRCLVATSYKPASDGYQDTRLIYIYMGAKGNLERFVGTKRMTEEAMDRYRYKTLAPTDKMIEEITVEEAHPKTVQVYPKESKLVISDNKYPIEVVKEYNEIEIPTKAGSSIGKIKYIQNDTVIHETDLIVKEDIKDKNILIRLQHFVANAFARMEGYIDNEAA